MPLPELETLPPMDDVRPPSVTDQIFDLLYARVVNLTLRPGAKLSEAEVAAQFGVSRQPVRDAFYRLSQLGFIQIRPQRATIVTPISPDAVMRAYFIRSALEEATMRDAAQVLGPADWNHLDALIDRQEAASRADDRALFHALDDQFHHDICQAAGKDFVWTLVRDNKGHMDRARFLSLSYGATTACAEHRDILQALRARDGEAAAMAARQHLSRIEQILDRLRSEQPGIFD